MEENLGRNEERYEQSEKRALNYFNLLTQYVTEKSYVPILKEAFDSWNKNHKKGVLPNWLLRRDFHTASSDFFNRVQHLNQTGKLDSYLSRSISYIYLRDLGKDLGSIKTKDKITRIVENVKNDLLKISNEQQTFSLATLYVKAKNLGIESDTIWVIDKLTKMSSVIPKGMVVEEAQRKMLKLIFGVLIHVIEELDEDLPFEIKASKLGHSLRLGYYYGLTYPFIDDLLDAKILNEAEKERYARFINHALTTGNVPELGAWSRRNSNLFDYIQSELSEGLEFIKSQQSSDRQKVFFDEANVFFSSQEADRLKTLSNPDYTNEAIYISIILKASSSRLIVRHLVSAPRDEALENRLFYYGLYNQLADDLSDLFEDLERQAVTPYTYFLTYHKKRRDLLNPFELYWSVIAFLISQVYQGDPHVRNLILDRAINGLHRLKSRFGPTQYKNVMSVFNPEHFPLHVVIEKGIRQVPSIPFFDKHLRDHLITQLKQNHNQQNEFLETVKSVRSQINSYLNIEATENVSPIIEAANYSLEGNGKRLRPILTWMIGVKGYGLPEKALLPLLKSLEYMHTASLIFDDLPSQDNSGIRRGRPAVHKVYSHATAELTGIFLTQKAIEEQASLNAFNVNAVLKLILYSSQTTARMCQGQAIDLELKGHSPTIEELEEVCFYKTGLAFEASLIMPAILAEAKDSEIKKLKQFAVHAGIAFQIKDDLLDLEGNPLLIGKPVGQDSDNQTASFVTILGQAEAKKHMWNHYCRAMEVLEGVPRHQKVLNLFLNGIVHRDR